MARGSLDRWNDRDEGWTVDIRIPWTDLMPTGARTRTDAAQMPQLATNLVDEAGLAVIRAWIESLAPAAAGP